MQGIDPSRVRGGSGFALCQLCVRGAGFLCGTDHGIDGDGDGYALLAKPRRAALRAPIWLPKQISRVQHSGGVPNRLKSLVGRNGSARARWSGASVSSPGRIASRALYLPWTWRCQACHPCSVFVLSASWLMFAPRTSPPRLGSVTEGLRIAPSSRWAGGMFAWCI